MYSTHSDESYEPTDGTSSKTQDAGIYDVGDALKKNLEERGIQVTYSQDTFLPHDAGAYRRSRSTAEELLKQAPAALLDLHRDGIPDPSEYEHQLEGQDVTKVRLLVGRSNANADANRAFAKEIKAVADEKYRGSSRTSTSARAITTRSCTPRRCCWSSAPIPPIRRRPSSPPNTWPTCWTTCCSAEPPRPPPPRKAGRALRARPG